MSKYLNEIPDMDSVFEHFGKVEYSEEFWKKVTSTIKKEQERFEDEENSLYPSIDHMKKPFTI